jgi:HEXXH motif-containing protein
VTTVDAAALLWTDADFEASLLATRARLAAVRAAVAADEVLSSADVAFLSRADEVLATPPAEWTDPRLTWWTVTATELIAATPRDPDALHRHLAEFGAVDLRQMGPTARCDGYSVVVNPTPFALPGWDKSEPAVAAGVAYHEAQVPLVEQTLAAMRRYAPDDFAAFCAIIRMIALKPPHTGGYDDFSEPLLPGSFIASVVANPLEMADHFVHELQHNRLSFVEERGSLFAPDQRAGGYYSPWRDSARSLLGVFHGVYVFIAVYRYWRAVLDDSPEGVAEYARDRVTRLPVQLAVAVRVLRRYGSLTPLGAALLDELTVHVEAINADSLADGARDDIQAFIATDDGAYVRETDASNAPVTVAAALRQHASRHPAGDQCATVVGDLWPFAEEPVGP